MQLPAWRPGRYELQHFAQKLYAVTATANGQSIPIQKITKDRWLVETNNAEVVEISYSFFARQMDAGGSWLDEEMLYLNPVNCLMAVEGREAEQHLVQLQLPEHWQLACGMPEHEKHTLLAADFDELADSPFIASGNLQRKSFEMDGYTFHVWVQGDCQLNWEQIIHDFSAYTREQLAVFGDFPVQEYHYLNLILPYRFYHGVEHRHSTVITLGPGEQLMDWSMYKEFVGVSSHELFHTWNVKKIRPAEMLPYDFKQENYFRTGYVAEGITTYYGDFILARSGFFTAEAYFAELNTTLQRYFADYSRYNLSVADSSFDLWLDGYKPGIPDRKVSIYIKGALTALLLDLQLRQATANAASLDSVMRILWERFGKTNIGYTEADYAEVVEEVAGQSFQAYFDRYITGTEPIEPALDAALRYVGCTLQEEQNPVPHEARFGFKLATDGTMKVTAIAPDSPASDLLSIDDELIALNGRKLENNNLPQLLALNPEQTELAFFREKQLRVIRLEPNGQTYYSKYTVQKREDATAAEQENFRLWLNQKF